MAGIMYTVKLCTPIWEGTDVDYNYCCDQDRNFTAGVVYSGLPFCSMFKFKVDFVNFKELQELLHAHKQFWN